MGAGVPKTMLTGRYSILKRTGGRVGIGSHLVLDKILLSGSIAETLVLKLFSQVF